MQISRNERFIKEYKEIQEFISACEDESTKKYLNELSKSLMNYVRILDNHHNDLLNLGKMPEDISETRNQVLDVRKKIFKLMKKN